MRVKLYRNLSIQYRASAKREGYVTWSLMHATGPRAGYIYENADAVILKDVEFVVGEKGRQRVLRLKKKNPHAFAVGEVVKMWPAESVARDKGPKQLAPSAGTVRIGYDPYTLKTFIREDCGEPVYEAPMAIATPHGLFAKLPKCKGKSLRGLEGMAFEVDPFDSANWYG